MPNFTPGTAEAPPIKDSQDQKRQINIEYYPCSRRAVFNHDNIAFLMQYFMTLDPNLVLKPCVSIEDFIKSLEEQLKNRTDTIGYTILTTGDAALSREQPFLACIVKYNSKGGLSAWVSSVTYKLLAPLMDRLVRCPLTQEGKIVWYYDVTRRGSDSKRYDFDHQNHFVDPLSFLLNCRDRISCVKILAREMVFSKILNSASGVFEISEDDVHYWPNIFSSPILPNENRQLSLTALAERYTTLLFYASRAFNVPVYVYKKLPGQHRLTLVPQSERPDFPLIDDKKCSAALNSIDPVPTYWVTMASSGITAEIKAMFSAYRWPNDSRLISVLMDNNFAFLRACAISSQDYQMLSLLAESCKIVEVAEKVSALMQTAAYKIKGHLRERLGLFSAGYYFLYSKDEKNDLVHIQSYIDKQFPGFEIVFINPKIAESCLSDRPMRANQIWILDDLNPFLPDYVNIFFRAILNAHEHGGMVFVTSEISYDNFLRHVLSWRMPKDFPEWYDRRARKLFGMSRLVETAVEVDLKSLVTFDHPAEFLAKINRIVCENKESITLAVQAELKKHFPGLLFEIDQSKNIFFVDASKVPPDALEKFAVDLEFFISHPGIALENICCCLDNYKAETPEQKYLLSEARRVIDLIQSGKKGGAFLPGPAGIGKTHVAIGIAKVLFSLGCEICFLTKEAVSTTNFPQDYTNIFNLNHCVGKKQVWILDDLNNPLLLPYMRLFHKAIEYAHQHGCLLAISIRPYNECLQSSLVSSAREGEVPIYDKIARELFGMSPSVQIDAIAIPSVKTPALFAPAQQCGVVKRGVTPCFSMG